MKKLYCQPEWKLVVLDAEDVITASGNGDGNYSYGDDWKNEGNDVWDW